MIGKGSEAGIAIAVCTVLINMYMCAAPSDEDTSRGLWQQMEACERASDVQVFLLWEEA